jgi:hypothetical protein
MVSKIHIKTKEKIIETSNNNNRIRKIKDPDENANFGYNLE